MTHGSLHHVELWVPDLVRARQQWGWLLGELGYEQFQDWDQGRSWRLGSTYLVNTDGFEVELVARATSSVVLPEITGGDPLR